jgi:hypothetical protein
VRGVQAAEAQVHAGLRLGETYFPPDSPGKFANVHRVFGAKNVSTILRDLPPHQRGDAVASLAYEADARLRDPVYAGCVSHITLLQCRASEVREEVASARRELAGYFGAAEFGPLVAAPPRYHLHPAAAQYAGAVHLGVGRHQQKQMAAAAAEVAREQKGVMMRQAAPGSGLVVPHDAVALYEGGFGLFQQLPAASQAQTAVVLTCQMESSPAPSSSGQSLPEERSVAAAAAYGW